MLDKEKIKQRIIEIAEDIMAYWHGTTQGFDFRYDVAVRNDGEVGRGDLHFNCNSWTEFHDPEDIIAEFSIRPVFSAEEIEASEYESDEPLEDPSIMKAWFTAGKEAIELFADYMAEKIVNRESIEDIQLGIQW